MSCREFIDFLEEYFSGTLPREVLDAFQFHMGICPDCVAYLNNYRRTIELGKGAMAGTDESLPASVPEDLVQAILAARRERR